RRGLRLWLHRCFSCSSPLAVKGYPTGEAAGPSHSCHSSPRRDWLDWRSLPWARLRLYGRSDSNLTPTFEKGARPLMSGRCYDASGKAEGARLLMKTSMRFDLVDLRLFQFVVEAASITHGAVRASMALASASERIRLMEESLGAPLLERHRRGVRATAAGAALAHHA